MKKEKPRPIPLPVETGRALPLFRALGEPDFESRRQDRSPRGQALGNLIGSPAIRQGLPSRTDARHLRRPGPALPAFSSRSVGVQLAFSSRQLAFSRVGSCEA